MSNEQPPAVDRPDDFDDVDNRIRVALIARAEQVTESMLRPVDPHRLGTATADQATRRWRWGAPLLAAAAVAAVAIATSLVIDRHDSRHPSSGPPVAPATVQSTPDAPVATRSAVPVSPTATSHPSHATHSASTTAPSPVVGPLPSGYQPLWPFADESQASAWYTAYQSSGSQPWHLDAGQTALLFTRNYLGFTDITTITSSVTDDRGAHVGVGFSDPGGVLHTSAVLHLLRFGSSDQAPWEVVGSDDTTLSLEQPQYGSTVSSPTVVGGHITGVDESIRVTVRQLGSQPGSAPLLATVPAGGDNTPWSTGPVVIPGHGIVNGLVTIVAATGGHLQQVERFAIQAVIAT